MASDACPVCGTEIPTTGAHADGGGPETAECPKEGCGAKLERAEGGSWTLQGPGPAG